MEKLIFDRKGEFAINFSWEDVEEPYWVNFKAAEVVSDYSEDIPKFITFDTGYGMDSNCFEFKDIEVEDLFFTGFIKWDGCMEIHNLHHHFCHKSDILQRVVDLIYEAGKDIMKVREEFE